MTSFDFSTANRVLFGVGTIRKIGEIVNGWGQTGLIVRGTTDSTVDKLAELLTAREIKPHFFTIRHEPTTKTIEECVQLGRSVKADFIIGIGGGSAIDVGKATAVLLANSGDVVDYLEVVGAGRSIVNPGLPMVAIPTTAGTGSEVTRNAVIGVPEQQVKVSLRSPYLLPRVALVDPELTLSLPPAITVSTGLDALTQLIEPFVTKKSNWLIDGLCRDGIARIARALPQVFDDPSNLQARQAMSYASLLSGMALANAGLGAVHGFAGPIGGMSSAPHGAICAALLPAVVKMNIRVLQTRINLPGVLEKYTELASLMTGKDSASLSEGIEWLEQLCTRLAVSGLKTYGITGDHFDILVEKASAASSMKGNPVELTAQEMRKILQESL